MAVKILIKRAIRSTALKDVSSLLIQARKNAMEHKGYISSETLKSIENPGSILIISMWHTVEDWETYKNSQARKDNERRFAEIISAPTEYEAFKLGL